MPNWCEGDLKIRGSYDNVKSFLTKALMPVSVFGEAGKVNTVYEGDDYIEIIFNDTNYIEGTKRAFVEGSVYIENSDETTIALVNFKQAWGIESEPLRALSQTYEVDLKIYGFECGMQFNQDIEIIGGVITKNEQIKFDDYNWDCIAPKIGG